MDTSAAAAGEGSSFTFRVKQEPGQGPETVAPPPPEDDSVRTIRKVTVLDPLKLKLLSRQHHNMLLSGLNAAKAKAKPPAPTPPPTVPASTTPVTATEGAPTNTTKAEPEPSSAAAEPPPEAVATKPPPPPPAVVKAPGAGGGSTLFRRKKVVPAVIAKKIAQKDKTKPAAPQPEATKEAVPAKPPPTVADVPPQQPARVKQETPAEPSPTPPAQVEEETTSNEAEPAAPASVTVKEEKGGGKAIRPTAFRRIKPKVAICLNPSRPKKSILKKNTSSEQLSPGKSAAKDLIPEETIVLEEDDEEREEDQRVEQKQTQQHEEEEQRRIREEEERRKEHAEEERKAAEAKRRIEEEERKMAEERRRIEEEERKKLEERRRIEVEERQKAEERRRIEEEERKKAEERRRIEEEERKKAEERRRIVEEEKKKVEERRRIEEEEKKKAEERQRIVEEEKKAEERQRIEEKERRKAEEKAKTEAEDRSKVELIRKSRKIPAEVWKLQMEKMRTNPNRLHNAVVSSEPPPVVAKDAVTVEKSDVAVCRESPVVAQQKPEQVVQSAEQRTPNPTKEIRRICPLPPSVARKLMSSVGLNSAMKKPSQDPVKPDTPKIEESTPVVGAEPSPASAPVVPQTKAIRRISRLPPNLASVIVSAVKQSTTQDNGVDKVEQRLPVVVPEKAPIEVKSTEETDLAERPVIPVEQSVPAPPATKAIKRIARLPPDLAKRLLSSVNQKKAIAESPSTIKAEPPKEVTETALPVTAVPPLEPLAHSVPAASSQVPKDSGPPVQVQPEPTPQKEIRRISQLPRNVAMKLVDSLKQKGITVPKLVLKQEAPAVPEPKSATAESQVLSEPTTPSSTASVPEIKIEPQEPPLTKTRRKVEILSQVILPTASYNLEELLAGKSTEGFNTGPSGSMPLPLPMPRARRPTTIVPPPAPVPAPIHDLPMIDDPIMKDDVASEVTVTTEKDETTDSAHELSDEYIVPECEVPSEDIPVQYDPPPKNIPQRQGPIHQSNQQTVFSGVQVPAGQQYPASYAVSSSQSIYSRTVQAPVIQQPTTSIPSGQPSITYYAKIPSSSSQPTTAPYRPHIIISRPMHPPRMVAQRMVLNPASVQQHPDIQGPRPRFAQYVLVRQPAPVRGRNEPQIQPQLPPQHQQQQQHQQQSRQHLMVPKATYYQRYPADGQNQHQVIYPTPRFMIPPQQSQHHPQPQPPQQQQRHHLNYIVPTISSQSKAFRPVEPAQSSHSPPKPHVIPKIVIDSSYVEQQDRSVGTPPTTEQLQPFQNHSPCSEEIRNKLRDKLRARMLRQNSQPESPSSETPPSTPLPPPPPPAPTPSQQSVPPKPEHRIPTIPPKVYRPQDFQQPRAFYPLPKPTTDNRVIKQYICQGRKIYLTKISVTKPVMPHAAQLSRPPPHQVQQYQLETGFHGFPQTAIKHDQRIFQQFSETVQQLERKISPEPPEEGQQHVPNNRMKSRKPSVVTAVTTGLEGETFIITELIDTPEVTQEVQVVEVKREVPVKHPPRITKRRKTFVVDDSDVELRVEQLPRVETTSQEESQGEEKMPAVKVKVEDEARGKSPERRSAFERRVKEEEFSDSDTSLADEDLARDILALVENERKSLRFDRPAKKVKKRIKRRKRRKKKKNGNEALMDLLMKHVNQESLIADIVAARQKQLPVVEISDTDEDEGGELQRQSHVVHVKKDPDAVESTESEVEIESDSSETDIFAEILKPFVEEDHQPEEEIAERASVVAEEPQQDEILETASVEAEEAHEIENAQTAGDVIAEPQEEEKAETAVDVTAELQEGENEETASAVAVEPQQQEKEKVETASVVAEEPQEEDSEQAEEKMETANAVTVEPQEEESMLEKEEVETSSAVIEEPQEKEKVETASAEIEKPQEEDSKQEEEKMETTNAVTEEPQEEEIVKPATAVIEEPQRNDTPVEEQSVDVPTKVTNEPETPEISAELATDPNPVIELTTQPTTKCDQICDTSSALPVEKPKKPKKAPAPRAPKRKLKPTLVSRPKVRKVEPPPPPPMIIATAADDEIEDYSDPFSDRDEPLPAAPVEESELQEVGANETLDAIKPPSVRELVDEWDSDEASRDVVRSTMIRPFGKHVSFDNNGNVPCRISKNNALKRAAMLNDTVEEVPTIETRIEESVQVTEEAPVPVQTEVKSVRVSVRKTDLLEREPTPEPEAVQMEEPAATDKAPTRVESTEQSVLNLLKDWDESPVKQRTGKPQQTKP